jgi:hypothetical protein
MQISRSRVYFEKLLKYNPQWCHWGFFPKLPTEPCALGSIQPLKTGTRILLGVKPASA